MAVLQTLVHRTFSHRLTHSRRLCRRPLACVRMSSFLASTDKETYLPAPVGARDPLSCETFFVRLGWILCRCISLHTSRMLQKHISSLLFDSMRSALGGVFTDMLKNSALTTALIQSLQLLKKESSPPSGHTVKIAKNKPASCGEVDPRSVRWRNRSSGNRWRGRSR